MQNRLEYVFNEIKSFAACRFFFNANYSKEAAKAFSLSANTIQ